MGGCGGVARKGERQEQDGIVMSGGIPCTKLGQREKDAAFQAPGRNPRDCFLGPFLWVVRESGETRLTVRSLKLFIAIYYVTHVYYLPKQLGCPLMREQVCLVTTQSMCQNSFFGDLSVFYPNLLCNQRTMKDRVVTKSLSQIRTWVESLEMNVARFCSSRIYLF